MVADYKIDEFMKRKKFMRTGSVAELLQVTDRTIRNWVEEGKLNAIRDGHGHYLFSRSEVKKYALEQGIL